MQSWKRHCVLEKVVTSKFIPRVPFFPYMDDLQQEHLSQVNNFFFSLHKGEGRVKNQEVIQTLNRSMNLHTLCLYHLYHKHYIQGLSINIASAWINLTVLAARDMRYASTWLIRSKLKVCLVNPYKDKATTFLVMKHLFSTLINTTNNIKSVRASPLYTYHFIM